MTVKIGKMGIRWWSKVPVKSSSWALGLSVIDLIESVLKNLSMTPPESKLMKGMYIFLSLPSILNAWGLTSVINQKLNDDEFAQLRDIVGHPERPT